MQFKKPKFWDHQGLSFWSVILFPLSIIFLVISFIVKISKIIFFKKNFKIPIICVGNIYIGGTGKTPLALEIFKFLKSIGKKPALIKKNYSYLSDEIEMLKKTGDTFVGKRKIAIYNSITAGNDIVILDDGFQDFSIKPNFSIVCFNSKQLIGNGFIIPSGPLRERLNAILRADCIVINGDKNLEFEDKISKNFGKKKLNIFYSKYKIKNIEKFENKKITAFAGIGNPINFFDLLKENGLDVDKTYSFPDHHNYSQKDFEKIKENNLTKIVTTEKDYCRMTNEQRQFCDYVEVSLEIQNKDKFKDLIQSYL
tara:strand:- start:236 stop:1168 length:933 start_codon:yes stop_codon:yes gene_type:complete